MVVLMAALARSERLRPGEWTQPELFGHQGEVSLLPRILSSRLHKKSSN